MKPKKSYRIWFSQRNGSTLLCKALADTGITGIPNEYITLMESGSLCEKYKVQTYPELRQKIWDLGTTPNGVFGIKHTMHTSINEKIITELKDLQGIKREVAIDEEELLSDIFPNCKHIYLTRRNKIRQAVSWWKAIKDNVWHLSSGQEQLDEAEFYEQHYDFAALSHLFNEATLRECAMQEYYAKYAIKSLTVVYEDFIGDFKNTIQQIVDFLEIPYDSLNIPEMHFKKTATSNSEKWVQRFRADLQKGMTEKIW